jgi:hypothetical protein
VLASAVPGIRVGNVIASPGAPEVVNGTHGKDTLEPPKRVTFVTPLTPVGADRLSTPVAGQSRRMAYTAPSAGLDDVYHKVVDSFCAIVHGTDS